MSRFVTALVLFAAAAPAAAQVKPTPLSVNTPADEDEPHVSSSGLALYYASNAAGKFDLMLAQRKKAGQPWAPGKPLDDYVRSEVDDRSTFVTDDRRFPQYLFFATKKDKTSDNFDLFVAQRIDANKVFNSPTPLNTVCTAADELHPWLSADGRALYFSRKTKDGWRVLVTKRKEASGAAGFGEPALVEELPADFHHATLTPDGKKMYGQGPVGEGRWGLFVSVRGAKGWGKPEPLDELNHPEGKKGDVSPCLSRDGAYLYFASDRPGGKGGLDLYAVPTAQLKK